VPEEYRRIFLENTFLAKEELLPVIYNIYHNKLQDKLNILGVGEVGRTKFYDEPKKLTPYYLAYMLHYRRSEYAIRECETWLTAMRPIARKHGLNIMTMFWWEILIGNWGCVGNSESDIAIEEYDPYDSHLLYETFLSVDPKYRTFRDNVLFRELIKYMWAQLLDLPFNPPDSTAARLKALLYKMGIEYDLRLFKAKVYELCYELLWKRKEPGD
jgi:hypothetical protein